MRHLPGTLILAMCFSIATDAASQTAPCGDRNITAHRLPARASVTFTRPPFDFEVERDGKNRTRFILTNEYPSPLTAYVEEITPVPDGQEGGVEHHFSVVDALDRSGDLEFPIPMGLSTVHGVTHNVGRADPQPGIAAVVFEDGRTYGRDDLVQRIIERRRLSSQSHQYAIDLLQTGLKERWDADRYVSEVRAREEELRSIPVDRQLNLVVEFPLEVVATNMIRMPKESPGSPAERFAKMLLETQLKQKAVVDAGLAAMVGPPAEPTLGCVK